MSRWNWGLRGGLLALAVVLMPLSSQAQDTICAKVKIEIKQELTLERQAFDAEMKINNALENASLTDIGVTLRVTDDTGVPVTITNDPNDLSAQFFMRVSAKENIQNVDGTGTVAPSSTATINWLIIPAPGAAGSTPFGKKYLVGATLTYKFGNEVHTLDVSPDVITVKPLPLLTLDYFLTQDVNADDPTTPAIEAIEPFTLGVRVKNTGMAVAKDLKIDSAQPKIIENEQGLLINFRLTGSYVDDAPVQNTLLIDFGNIEAGKSKMGRWNMETTLAGTFTEFTAKFSHSDELGGALTSILQATNAHFLIRDVRVDLPGRDPIRDFLAKDGEDYKVFESEGLDTDVIDRSTQATLSVQGGKYKLQFPATSGFVYARRPDPFNGHKVLGTVVRSDAKQLLPDNVWLSKVKNRNTKQWEYYVNFFDVNSSGSYNVEFQDSSTAPRPPVLQFIPDRTADEGQQVSFMIEASSPDGRPITLSAAPLPSGASFVMQPPDPMLPGVSSAIFDWTPSDGQSGNFLISYTAQDALLSASRSAFIKVEVPPPPVPGEPVIESPMTGVQVTTTRPALVVRTSTAPRDRTVKLQFEVYADEAMTQLAASSLVDKGVTTGGEGTTSFMPADSLDDNHHFWWRVRAFDGVDVYSPWVNGRFFVNTFNDPPDTFNLTSPAPGIEVTSDTPALSWTNSADKDGDAILYRVFVYADGALSELVTSSTDLPPGEGGSSTWTVNQPLNNHETYYWKVVAVDSHGAETASFARAFTVNTGNSAPTLPLIVSPADGGQTQTASTALTVETGTDAENDLITYVFELDTVNTFDSGNKRSSGPVVQSTASHTSWTVTALLENQVYWWRIKAQDGRAETGWVVASFRMNAVNQAPPAPTIRNPGDGAWTSSLQPTLEANPVQEPEDEPVSYQFEVYRGADLGSLVASGSSSTEAWQVNVALQDKTTHSWRVRAVDSHGAASAWSAKAVLYVSSGSYQNPSVQMTSPASPVTPAPVGGRKKVLLRWDSNDPNIENTVALYYATNNTDYAGTLIVDGFHNAAGSHSGEYEWDVTDLPVGTYYVYGVIYDVMGYGKAYAPGAVVIAPPAPTGTVVVTAGNNLKTSEAGQSVSFTVRLGSAPTANVILPVLSSRPQEGIPTVAQLVFTPQNWSTAQTVTVVGVNDCINDNAQAYQILMNDAVSLDPNYMGVDGIPVAITNNDDAELNGTTNSSTLRLCNYKVVSERQVGLLQKEFVMSAELTNTGLPLSGVTATLVQAPLGVQIVEGQLQFGAVNTGETAKSVDTFTVKSTLTLISDLLLQLSLGLRWDVAPQQ
jgi:hypothetical protein